MIGVRRVPKATVLLPELAAKIDRIAARHRVGASWVLAVVAGRVLGVDVESYE